MRAFHLSDMFKLHRGPERGQATKNPQTRVKRKGGFHPDLLAEMFNVARNPVTNRHIGGLRPPAGGVNTVTVL
ncbi:hypothetical protein GCM10007385_23960 [Tateyamaria omphalii]|nr:hypothetical protein GCM10007385_23960 [Tateyamaria omphalii]